MRRTNCLVVALLVAMGWPGSAASAQSDLERKVKSAFILNFAKFITWPDSAFNTARQALRVCADSSDTVNSLAQVMQGKTVGQRPLEVTQLPADDCQIIYATGPEAAQSQQYLSARTSPGVLTVYETPQALDGGVIRFFVQDRKVRFEIDRDEAAAANLSISSKLLRVATIRGGE